METMESTGHRPQLLRTPGMSGFDRALNTKALEGYPRHPLFQDIEKEQGVPGTLLGAPESDNEDEHDDGSSNLTSRPGWHDWSPDATPDTEDFPSKQLPARLQDSIGDIKCLQKDIDEPNLDSASSELVEVLALLQSTNTETVSRIFDVLLVWLYKLKHVQHFLLQIKKTTTTDTDHAVGATTTTTTTVSLLLEVKTSTLDPPRWLLVVLESSGWHGRWPNELSIRWVDTTWRTAFSALHVGSISPVASLPRLNPERLKALWSARRLTTSSTPVPVPVPVPVPEPSVVHTSVPCIACAPKRPATPSSSTVTGSGSSKKQKKEDQQKGKGKGKGKGKAKEEDEDPDDSSSDHDGPLPPPPADGAPSKPLYACHFYKRYPLLHLNCLYHSQTAPRYVKCHLKRSHKQPIHCPICYQSFKTRAANNRHIVLGTCDRGGSDPYADSISEDTEAALDRLATKGDGPDKWFEIWDKLFPDAPRPASPFVEPGKYQGIVVASVGEHKASAFRDSLGELPDEDRFTDEQVGIIMQRFAQTFGTEAPSPASSSGSSSPPPAGQPVVLPPGGGGGGHSQMPSAAPPAPPQQAESESAATEPEQLILLQLQRQQQEWWRRRQQQLFRQQQQQLEHARRQEQHRRRYQQQIQQNQHHTSSQAGYPLPSAYFPSRSYHPQAQNSMPPPPSPQHGSWSRFQHATGPPGGNYQLQQPPHPGVPTLNNSSRQHANQYATGPSGIDADASQQRSYNAAAHTFDQQYQDMTQAFGVPQHFLQSTMPQNAQFPGSDTRSQQTLASQAAAARPQNNRQQQQQQQQQVMMPEATWSNLIDPRDLQTNRVADATAPLEREPPAAEPAAAAAAPVGHDEPGSEEEVQGSPDEPVDDADYFYIPGTGGIGDDDEDDGLGFGGFDFP